MPNCRGLPHEALSPPHADVKYRDVDSFDPTGLEADRIDQSET